MFGRDVLELILLRSQRRGPAAVVCSALGAFIVVSRCCTKRLLRRILHLTGQNRHAISESTVRSVLEVPAVRRPLAL